MQRPGVGPIRGLPSGFPSQQQMPQSRAPTGRLPNGKIVSNGATWAFGGAVPMGAAGLQGQNPRANAPMASFAQSLGGSQPATPLDLSEFPSLSNNPPQQSNPAQSLWAAPSARTIAQSSNPRAQQSSLLQGHQQAQTQRQQQQDDLFSSSSQLPSNQGSFRFGGNAVGSSQMSAGPADDFPPLSRGIGQERSSLMSNIGFGGQTGGSAFGSSMGGSSRTANNALLNMVNGGNRTASVGRVMSPAVPAGLTQMSSNAGSRHGGDDIEESINQSFSASESAPPTNMGAFQDPGVILSSLNTREGAKPTSPKQQHETSGNGDVEDGPNPELEIEDPCAGMSDMDRFGLKGYYTMLKGPYSDQAALMSGIDLNGLGLDLASSDSLTDSIWSPFDDTPARPDIPKFNLPECYQVLNTAPIETKMSNLSDESLLVIFYTEPQSIRQMLAAQELTTRNWRYHKPTQLWLTKDAEMTPQQIDAGSERGYYTFWSPNGFRERREFTLIYSELEAVNNGVPGM